jgi:hypothetical protein
MKNGFANRASKFFKEELTRNFVTMVVGITSTTSKIQC